MFNHTEENNEIKVDELAKSYMLEIGRWGKFLAIVGFIMMGLMIVGSLFMAFFMASLPSTNANPYGGAFMGAMGVGMALIYIVVAAIYFYPTWAMYKFATTLKRAIANNDQHGFNQGFEYLKGSFKYMGILMIIVLVIYAVGALFGGVVALIAGMAG